MIIRRLIKESKDDYDDKISELNMNVKNNESRISRLEDGMFNNIIGNPYMITFENLNDIVLSKGVWNQSQKRIEF